VYAVSLRTIAGGNRSNTIEAPYRSLPTDARSASEPRGNGWLALRSPAQHGFPGLGGFCGPRASRPTTTARPFFEPLACARESLALPRFANPCRNRALCRRRHADRVPSVGARRPFVGSAGFSTLTLPFNAFCSANFIVPRQ
jgi:hypothetical protein